MEQSLVRYRNVVTDSARWEGFEFRDGDIVISTPAKCGTTWTQTICALLIFQTSQLPAPVDMLSPWIDQSLRPLDSVLADLAGQKHRRFIKSHTPFDGMPFDERVTYITVGRDPRDVALSWDNHMANLNLEAFLTLRGKAVGNEDLAELMPDGPPPPPPESESERFWLWVQDQPGQDFLSGMAGMLHHLGTFWNARNRPNVLLLHYDDLKTDLEGQMRSLAGRLGIDMPEEKWPELVKAATFDEMKAKAAKVAPNSTEPIWLDTNRFFNRGTSGQWTHLLDDEGMKRYRARVSELVDPDLSDWVHRAQI